MTTPKEDYGIRPVDVPDAPPVPAPEPDLKRPIDVPVPPRPVPMPSPERPPDVPVTPPPAGESITSEREQEIERRQQESPYSPPLPVDLPERI